MHGRASCVVRWVTVLGLIIATSLGGVIASSGEPASATTTSCGSAGYHGPIGCILLSGSSWAPTVADLGDLNVYNNSDNLNHFGPDRGFTYEYQCTELAVRYAYYVWGEGKGLSKPEAAWDTAGWDGAAEDMWSVAPRLAVPLQQIANGAGAPQFGDLIIFGEPKGSSGPGHVGVVTGVSGTHLYFVGENQANAPAKAWIPINAANHASSGGDFSTSLVPIGWLRPVRPKIVSVSSIQAAQTQTIAIKGSGFGTGSPFNGDRPCVRFTDSTAGGMIGWNAGHVNPLGQPSNSGGSCSSSQGNDADQITLNVTSWTNTQITISGFTGAYGAGYWVLSPNDAVTISVWNAQSGSGPANLSSTVS